MQHSKFTKTLYIKTSWSEQQCAWRCLYSIKMQANVYHSRGATSTSKFNTDTFMIWSKKLVWLTKGTKVKYLAHCLVSYTISKLMKSSVNVTSMFLVSTLTSVTLTANKCFQNIQLSDSSFLNLNLILNQIDQNWYKQLELCHWKFRYKIWKMLTHVVTI